MIVLSCSEAVEDLFFIMYEDCSLFYAFKCHLKDRLVSVLLNIAPVDKNSMKPVQGYVLLSGVQLINRATAGAFILLRPTSFGD